MSEITNKNYKGMYSLFDFKESSYNFSSDVFTAKLEGEILAKTGLRSGNLEDWWLFDQSHPELTWKEMIELALGILNCEATRLFVRNLYLGTVPEFVVKKVKLPESYVGGAKRVNFSSGTYHDYTGAVGLGGLANPNRDEILRNPPKKTTKKFRGCGKDEGCSVEGSWWHWVCLACNVLASENTKLSCPELYEPALKNDNY